MDHKLGNSVHLSIDSLSELEQVAYMLSSPVRLEVLRLLSKNSLVSVSNIAKALGMPLSTVSTAVKTLEEAGLIATEVRPGQHGATKLCRLRTTQIRISLIAEKYDVGKCIELKVPVGGYSIAQDIRPTCGLISEFAAIGVKDAPAQFYSPDRFHAQLLWFHSGFVEYHLSSPHLEPDKVAWIEISFEACSEAPLYKNPWESDISVFLNDCLLGVWTCPCDCGGRHGVITPQWWADYNTQFGFMKTWYVDAQGTYLDRQRISGVTLRDLKLENNRPIRLRIGIDRHAAHVGGINLFGEKFGDYAQGLTLRIGVL